MKIFIDTSKERTISIAPKTVIDEIEQNLWFLFSNYESEVPLDRNLGMNIEYINRTMEIVETLLVADIYDKCEKYEPRVEILNINIKNITDKDTILGKLYFIVEVKIDEQYIS